MKKSDPTTAVSDVKVEDFEFEPIKGFPMLHWKGKRPFTSTQFYPAQLKEMYGKPESDGWVNKVFWGDNLQVMSHLLKDYRGKVQLIYIDPPFDSNADYKMSIKRKSQTVYNDHGAFEEKQYTDIWLNDTYLQFFYERLVLMKELLTETGNIFVHCDDTKNYLIRALLDEVFSPENFVNEIIWKRSTATGLATRRCGTLHDTIYWYSKTPEYKFTMQYHAYEEDYLKRARKDETGREYIPIPTGNPGYRPNLYYSYKGYFPPDNGYKWTKEKMEELDRQGRLIFPENKDGRIQLKQYLDQMEGMKLQDIWIDIPPVNPVAKERVGYPTQKPERLIERIVKMGSDEGDIVFDSFLGSGTTGVVALKNKRKFIGGDINLGAIRITSKRLSALVGTGDQNFAVYNVNHYDIFRNPVEAKELLLKALEATKISNSIFDAEKDGRMVKIMPVNRIATRADLADLVSGFDYKVFEKRQIEHPNRPVEKLLLVCMGHEPGLAAYLEKEVNYKLDVQVVDILRDKADLQFKRESEAKLSIKKNKLTVEKFFPMNLLQKLSLQKEKVSDWRELTESILIDWNYDGAVLEPTIVDIPEQEKFVAGTYDIPENAGTIRVKITDLLSESVEVEITRE